MKWWSCGIQQVIRSLLSAQEIDCECVEFWRLNCSFKPWKTSLYVRHVAFAYIQLLFDAFQLSVSSTASQWIWYYSSSFQIIFTFERHSEWSKYCNRRKILLRFLWVSILYHILKSVLEKMPVCLSLCTWPNVEPKPIDRSLSNSIAGYLTYISILFLIFPLTLKLIVVHIRKK